MKKIVLLLMVLILGGCIEAGEFTPETHKLYEMGKPDWEKLDGKCF